MSALELDLEVTRGDFRLSIKAAEAVEGVLGIHGPSGAGKTTLLRALAGLEPMARGRVRVAGEVWLDGRRSLAVHRRPLGYVFQEPRLLPDRTVRSNLDYALRRGNTGRLSLDEVVAMLGLESLLARRPAGLSGGERQRVAIARALLRQPRLLLMDEPLAALDHAARRECLAYLRNVGQRLGIPTVFVSHSLDELAALSDRLWVLRQGRLVASGSVAAVIARLDLGEMTESIEAGSVFDAEVHGHDMEYQLTRLVLGENTLLVPGTEIPVGTRLRLHIHSRDVAIACQPPVGISIRNVIPGTLVALRRSLPSPYVDVALDIGAGVLRARVTRAATDELGLAEGMRVYALVKSVSVEAPAALERAPSH